MRRNVEEVVCDRCGKVVSECDFLRNTYSVTSDYKINDEPLRYEYQELCRRCQRTVLRRLKEAGPLKGAPKREEVT